MKDQIETMAIKDELIVIFAICIAIGVSLTGVVVGFVWLFV